MVSLNRPVLQFRLVVRRVGSLLLTWPLTAISILDRLAGWGVSLTRPVLESVWSYIR